MKTPTYVPGRRRVLPPWVLPGLLLAAAAPMLLSRDVGTASAAAPAATQNTAADPNAPAPGGVEEHRVQLPRMNLVQWYQAGGMFMHPILLCSIIAVALTIERAVSLRAGGVVPRGFLPALKGAMRDVHDPAAREAGLAYCRANDSPIARIVAAGIKRAPRGPEAAEKAMEDAGAGEAMRLRRNMRFLYSIASVATLLGLIGTIQGMIQAFQAAEVVGTGKFGPLARGIYVALVTTFAGLLVAIPVTIVYYYFAGRIERLIGALNDDAGEFEDHYLPPGADGTPPRARGRETNGERESAREPAIAAGTA